MNNLASSAEFKKHLREQARARRASISQEKAGEGARRIAETGLGFLALPPDIVVGAYYPVRDELDCRVLLTRLIADGYRVALPAIGTNRILHFHLWSPDEALETGPFGIPQPTAEAPEADPDVLLLPLLAFDANGRRLGYGGGHYDATLARLRQSRPRTVIGLAFDEQEMDSLPLEPHDQPLDWVLTPSGPRHFAQAS